MGSSYWLGKAVEYQEEQKKLTNLITQINTIISGIPDIMSETDNIISEVELGAVVKGKDLIVGYNELQNGKKFVEGIARALNTLKSDVQRAKGVYAELESGAMAKYHEAKKAEESAAAEESENPLKGIITNTFRI